jgi:hypothetical protein
LSQWENGGRLTWNARRSIDLFVVQTFRSLRRDLSTTPAFDRMMQRSMSLGTISANFN